MTGQNAVHRDLRSLKHFHVQVSHGTCPRTLPQHFGMLNILPQCINAIQLNSLPSLTSLKIDYQAPSNWEDNGISRAWEYGGTQHLCSAISDIVFVGFPTLKEIQLRLPRVCPRIFGNYYLDSPTHVSAPATLQLPLALEVAVLNLSLRKDGRPYCMRCEGCAKDCNVERELGRPGSPDQLQRSISQWKAAARRLEASMRAPRTVRIRWPHIFSFMLKTVTWNAVTNEDSLIEEDDDDEDWKSNGVPLIEQLAKAMNRDP